MEVVPLKGDPLSCRRDKQEAVTALWGGEPGGQSQCWPPDVAATMPVPRQTPLTLPPA